MAGTVQAHKGRAENKLALPHGLLATMLRSSDAFSKEPR
jgi:hypothetical protein